MAAMLVPFSLSVVACTPLPALLPRLGPQSHGNPPISVRRQEESGSTIPVQLPPGARVLYEFHGEEGSHLGIGLAALKDIDGDDVPDFAIGAMSGAYTFSFGPGFVLVVSGSTGEVISKLAGTQGKSGDAYGDMIRSIGDADGDGVPELTVSAWRWTGYRGFTAQYSGRTRELRYSVVGSEQYMERPETLPGDLPPGYDGDEFLLGGAFGKCVPVGDVDEDDCADFVVDGWLISGKDGRPIVRAKSNCLGRTGDVDLDGKDDLLFFSDWPRTHLEVRSALTQEILHETEVRIDKHSTVQSAGDHNGDGFLDVLVAGEEPGPPVAQGGRPRQIRVGILNGVSCQELLPWIQKGTLKNRSLQVTAVGDFDGDGVGDWLTRTGPDSTPSRSFIVIRSGSDGRELHTLMSNRTQFGTRVCGLGDLDGDGCPELLISDYEACVDGIGCGGAAYVLSLCAE